MITARFSRMGWATSAAVAACAVACSLPLLSVWLFGTGAAAAALAGVFRHGAELVVGGVTFALILAALAARSRKHKTRALSAGANCPVVCGCTGGAPHELTR